MGSELQFVVVVAIISLAAAYVTWTVVARFWSRGKSCGSACSGCNVSEKSPGKPKAFVGIDALSSFPKK